MSIRENTSPETHQSAPPQRKQRRGRLAWGNGMHAFVKTYEMDSMSDELTKPRVTNPLHLADILSCAFLSPDHVIYEAFGQSLKVNQYIYVNANKILRNNRFVVADQTADPLSWMQ